MKNLKLIVEAAAKSENMKPEEVLTVMQGHEFKTNGDTKHLTELTELKMKYLAISNPRLFA